jgi:hypothetical protein
VTRPHFDELSAVHFGRRSLGMTLHLEEADRDAQIRGLVHSEQAQRERRRAWSSLKNASMLARPCTASALGGRTRPSSVKRQATPEASPLLNASTNSCSRASMSCRVMAPPRSLCERHLRNRLNLEAAGPDTERPTSRPCPSNISSSHRPSCSLRPARIVTSNRTTQAHAPRTAGGGPDECPGDPA